MQNLEVGQEVSTNQFAQVVQSFFRIHPEKAESHLLAYVCLESNLDADAFIEWRKR